MANYQTLDSDVGPVNHLIYDPKTGKHIKIYNPTGGKFIKGPIPLDWISSANALPGKTGAVGIALWFLQGIKKSKTFKLTSEVEQIAACNRKSRYQALEAMEKAGLIHVARKPGSRPTITICDLPLN